MPTLVILHAESADLQEQVASVMSMYLALDAAYVASFVATAAMLAAKALSEREEDDVLLQLQDLEEQDYALFWQNL